MILRDLVVGRWDGMGWNRDGKGGEGRGAVRGVDRAGSRALIRDLSSGHSGMAAGEHEHIIWLSPGSI